jgi:hypothetical protein
LPVVVLAGPPARVQESGSGLRLHHQGRRLDGRFSVVAEITRAETRPGDPPTRPVELKLPRDVAAMEAGPRPAFAASAFEPEAATAAAAELAARLARAGRLAPLRAVEVRH